MPDDQCDIIQPTCVLEANSDVLQCLCNIPNHQHLLVSGSVDQTVRLWNEAAATCLPDSTFKLAAMHSTPSAAADITGELDQGLIKACSNGVSHSSVGGISTVQQLPVPDAVSTPTPSSDEQSRHVEDKITGHETNQRAAASSSVASSSTHSADSTSPQCSQFTAGARLHASLPVSQGSQLQAVQPSPAGRKWKRIIRAGNKSILPDCPAFDSAETQQSGLQECLALARLLYPLEDEQGAGQHLPLQSQQQQCQEQQQRQQQQQHQQQQLPGDLLAYMTADVQRIRQMYETQQLPADCQAGMHLMCGDAAAFMRVAVAADAITPDAVALSAGFGMQMWRAVAHLYAAKQEAAGQPHTAALHLLASGDVEGAAAVYRYRLCNRQCHAAALHTCNKRTKCKSNPRLDRCLKDMLSDAMCVLAVFFDGWSHGSLMQCLALAHSLSTPLSLLHDLQAEWLAS